MQYYWEIIKVDISKLLMIEAKTSAAAKDLSV